MSNHRITVNDTLTQRVYKAVDEELMTLRIRNMRGDLKHLDKNGWDDELFKVQIKATSAAVDALKPKGTP